MTIIVLQLKSLPNIKLLLSYQEEEVEKKKKMNRICYVEILFAPRSGDLS